MKLKKYFCLFLAAAGFLLGSCEESVPSAPSGLVADAVTGATFVLRWTDNSYNERNFLVQKSLDDQFADCEVRSVTSNIRSVRDTDLDPDTTFFYRVAAANKAGVSEWSETLSARINE